MPRTIHRLFNSLGFEVRRLSNLQRNRQAEQLAAEHDRWRLLKNFRIDTILDIGANEGQFASLMRSECPQARVYSFEPLPSVHEKLVAAFREDPQVVPVNLALGNENGSVPMNQSAFSPSSSLLPMGALHATEWPKTAQHTQVPVRLARLDDWMREAGLQEPGGLMVKLDVQGYERAVIEGGRDTIRRASLVISEVSFYELYEGQALFADIHQLMAGLGFRYRGNIDQHYSRKSNKILFADAVFENTNLDPDTQRAT
jgi:FkbM family methyltransferase